jgi:hypothetical protein
MISDAKSNLRINTDNEMVEFKLLDL